MPLEVDRKRAWVTLVVAHMDLTALVDARMDAAGTVPWEQYNVLLALEEAEDGHLRLGELAKAMGLTASGATRLVDRLERAGLVQRVHCPTDRRAVHAEITPAGRAARAAAWPVYANAVDDAFRISDDDARTLARILEPLAGGRPLIGI